MYVFVLSIERLAYLRSVIIIFTDVNSASVTQGLNVKISQRVHYLYVRRDSQGRGERGGANWVK